MMTKIIYRIYKKNETKLIASFSVEEFARKLAKKLDFEVYIKKVLIDDGGKVLNV